ncbi:hypothetical protein B1748_28495 [Paenibacillus sp. MY03]|jgi:uncharacterized membrane protein YcjF (UPF0283 family)|uniref:hypothetical protein n=1 Tax=Paenibacillus TaxID=44249 RepID=UPI000B3CE747|nr:MULTISPECIES: hypothetical protein [Paenibacillus]OUS70435.1 hypothetical protein B1748_28495 [Paenibacillus sp. MY03]
MDNDKNKEIDELKQRIATLENQVNNTPRRSNLWRFGITFIIVLFALMVSIGVFQFVAVK